MARPALGRGLDALLGGHPVTTSRGEQASTSSVSSGSASVWAGSGEAPVRVPLSAIRPNPRQPRQLFQEESLLELAESIRAQGILQPLVVRRRADGYELIAGERRWRAAQMVGLTEVPVLVRDVDDRSALELALVENLQREDLNPIEEAQGYAQLLDQFGFTQEEAARRVGKSRAAVANALRLLKLPEEIQAHLRNGKLSVGHAKVILALEDPDLQKRAAECVVKDGLNVRQTEGLVARLQASLNSERRSRQVSTRRRGDPQVLRLEDRLRERLGTRVRLHYNQGRGKLEIVFFSDAELERILETLGVAPD
ncbi:MAG: ParB/RepB/Spo0J family partition protein [Verrucomicrobiota bacterium]|nr:ParB/RepB/Spo0J family partition protein [Limisphaera sp.]MDW8381730.1 ParB/RepB/Spo0J family partition protein [Verrucomicrobiota bacterium]